MILPLYTYMPSTSRDGSTGTLCGRVARRPAPLLQLTEYDDEQELITGLDGLLSGMPEAPLDAFCG